jgi:alkanesulfonate monooxygenase SsuD/methylene tetrahydromethanopterin reductase-like flavin-dependent oxidoreductase (luciferase family)
MKKLWTEDRPTFAGKYYTLDAPPYRIETLQQRHPPIAIGGGDDALLRIIAKHADLASPMIPVVEAKPKISAVARELGRDISAMRWQGGGTLFLHDDPGVERMAINYAIEHFGGTEESVRTGGLFGNTETVRQRVREQIADGCTDIIVFQLPRVHMKSLMRFSDDIIPSFV